MVPPLIIPREGTAPTHGSDRPLCYRHRPDLTYQRLADQVSMQERQRKLEELPHSRQQAIDSIWTFFSHAPEEDRHLALDGIMAQCCFSQLSYISISVKALIRIDFLAALPNEISILILQYLDATTLSKAAQVSQLWRRLADDDLIWYRMCQQHINKKCSKCGWSLPLLQAPQQPQQSQQQENLDSDNFFPRNWGPSRKRPGDSEAGSSSHDSCLGPPRKRQRMHHHQAIELDTTSTRPWKEVYKERLKVGLNWKHGRYRETVLEGHTDSVMCLQIYNKFLVTGSYDASIKLWNLDSGSLVRTFLGHAAGIRAIQFDGSKIVSGSLDETIKIWNWQTGQCLLTISNHNDAIVGLDLVGKILASASKDKTIKLWNFDSKEAFTLRGHRDGVNSVHIDTNSRTLISASDDFTLRLWDLDTRQCIRVFEGHCGQVEQASFSPVGAEYSHLLESTPLADSPTHQKDTDLARSSYGDGFSTCPERSLPPLYVVSGSLDNTLRLWNTASGTCVRVDFGHTEGVWVIATDNLRVVSGAGDSLVKVWDTTTGNCLRTIALHTMPVTCIGLTDSMLATGSDDCCVIVCNFKPNEVENPSAVQHPF
ncbi:quinon protein alcohol dehydrogenase-like superfamily [Xylaria arbuscula]|nr:quinon protein alcohol dehydrogenase-like superfamily [Xylaria arbuscula]